MQVGDLSAPQLRFKVDVNARENHMSGASLALAGTFALVVVEGTQKTLRRCVLLVGWFAFAFCWFAAAQLLMLPTARLTDGFGQHQMLHS